MYRYSHHVREGMGLNRNHRRVMNILCLVLAVAVIVLGVLYARSGTFQANYEDLRVRRMQSEANQALQEYKGLSTTGGTSSSGVLARIRQHVYAVESMEELHAGLAGAAARTVDVSLFDQVDNALARYENKLQMGQAAQSEQSELLALLEHLVAATRTH